MKNRFLGAIFALTLPLSALSDWGPTDYTITKASGANAPRVVTSAAHGTWEGFIGTELPMDEKKTHELIFEFQSPNYFSATNAGHFAVAVRANFLYNGLEGRGIILGSVQDYGPLNAPCLPTSIRNVIAIEHFLGDTGNCVYGSTTQGPKLVNNKRYRVQLVSQYVEVPGLPDLTVTSYKLWERNAANTQWILLEGKSATENIGGPIYNLYGHTITPNVPPLNSSGVFFLEVFSTHAWTFEIKNMQSKTCNTPQCTNL